MAQPRSRILLDQLVQSIRDGRLKPGDQLPPVRQLMKQHGLALATAAKVYRELENLGLVVGETGRGTFVRDQTVPRVSWVDQQRATEIVDLTFNYPSLPGQDELLREGLRGVAAVGDLDALMHSQPHGGRLHERETVARHLLSRGVQVSGAQVFLLNGAQHGLSITMGALFKPGDVIAVDALTYPGLLNLARHYSLEVVAIPVGDHGTDLDVLAEVCRQRKVKAVYTMPTLHNPLGVVMPAHQREALAQLARRFDLILLEDGAYAFLAEPAPPPLWHFAPERTVYVSALSKSVASGLRFGFLAVPPQWTAIMEHTISVTTWSTSSIVSALACRWLDMGVVEAWEHKKREDARQRQALAAQVFSGLDIQTHPASYFVWIRLPEEVRADVLAADLARQGVLVSTAAPFCAHGNPQHALRVALGSLDMNSLAQALASVRHAIDWYPV
ncbi:aminotransferase-like domain-containing protein [Leeia oryzae]|uniref:aminotransferase-like domain-containing protein n=1 Tax=Leeia oryzae TaxID=356662 RepID=UPI000381EA06|nr:PLP-dependent aminotransferase family protein [Leeia oryzae]